MERACQACLFAIAAFEAGLLRWTQGSNALCDISALRRYFAISVNHFRVRGAAPPTKVA